MNQLIGFGASGGVPRASFTFNGTDEALTRTLSTSAPGTTVFTYSVWLKVTAYSSGIAPIWQVINAPTNSQFLYFSLAGSGDDMEFAQDSGSVDWGETNTALTPDVATGTWEHWVLRFDSTQGTSDDRIRIYRNGTQITDAATALGEPALNEAHTLFTNGRQHQIGAFLDVPRRLSGKLALIDVLDGVSVDASAFGFDNGGTWTHQPYAGSYGTYGFRLDGTDLFNDVSGNAQHFTGVNMDATNLDYNDLPPGG